MSRATTLYCNLIGQSFTRTIRKGEISHRPISGDVPFAQAGTYSLHIEEDADCKIVLRMLCPDGRELRCPPINPDAPNQNEASYPTGLIEKSGAFPPEAMPCTPVVFFRLTDSLIQAMRGSSEQHDVD